MKKMNIFNSRIVVVSLLFFLIKPTYFSQFLILDKLYAYGSLFSTVILMLLLLKTKLTKPAVWILAFYGTAFLSTIVGTGEVYAYIKAELSSLAMCLLFYLWLEKNPRLLLNAFRFFEIYVYINLVTILLFPGGLYHDGMYSHCWFLGYKNPQIRTILPILCISLIRSYWKHGRISFSAWSLMLCTVLTVILNDSATSAIGMAVFLLLLFLFHKKNSRVPSFMTLMNGILLTIAAFVMVAVYQMQYLFSGFIEGILMRDLTFTERVFTWTKSMEAVKQRMLLGYGYMTGTEYSVFYNDYYSTHPHNFYLYVLMTGGIVLFAILMTGFSLASQRLNNTSATIYSKIILFAIFSFLIMGLTESLISTVLLYPVIIMGMEIENILKRTDYGEK